MNNSYIINLSNNQIENLKILTCSNGQRTFFYKPELILWNFFKLPNFIEFKKINNKIFLRSTITNLSSIKVFIKKFIMWLKFINKKLVKRFILKGLGLRFFSTSLNCIQFKLGFSHIIELFLPKIITFNILDKNKLCILGHDNVLLGNFSEKIKNFKPINSYTGKGLFLKNENKLLKPVKKN